MHQSFVSTAPLGLGNNRAFNLSVFKSPALQGQICGKIPAKSPGSSEADSNVEQQLVVVLMKKKYERGILISACKCTGTFVN